jgi:glycerophosphoryl diester phosphodiesterase
MDFLKPDWDKLPPMPVPEGLDHYPVIVGHRGAAGLAPENTLAAFGLAIELGVDGVELDVQRTADGYEQ